MAFFLDYAGLNVCGHVHSAHTAPEQQKHNAHKDKVVQNGQQRKTCRQQRRCNQYDPVTTEPAGKHSGNGHGYDRPQPKAQEHNA